MEVVYLPTILGEENWKVQIPDFGFLLEFELVVVWNWIGFSNNSLSGDDEYFVKLIWIVEGDFELGQRWNEEVLTILPYTWKVLFELDLPFL